MNSDNFESKIPRVWIGMSTFNSAATVRTSIESVIAQNFQEWQLVIRDANSTDETLSICLEYQLRDSRINVISLNETNGWLESARNHIIDSKANYFAFLDGDDYISDDWISELVTILKCENSIAAFGRVDVIDQKGSIVRLSPSSGRLFKFTSFESRRVRIALSLLLPESFGLVNILYSVWDRAAIYDLAITRDLFSDENDWDFDFDQIFVLEALSLGKISYSKNPTIFRRLKPEQYSVYTNSSKDYSRVFKRSFLLTYIWEILTVKPKNSFYYNWVRNQKNRNLYFMILFFRIIVSVFSPILIRVKHRVVK